MSVSRGSASKLDALERRLTVADVNLAELRRLQAEATPGPWRAGGSRFAGHDEGRIMVGPVGPDGDLRRLSDALLAVAAVNALPALLDAADLGLAWAECEAALPKRWHVMLAGDWENGWEAEAIGPGVDITTNDTGWFHQDGGNATPAAAFRSLIARLREEGSADAR